jgi:D-alanyl-D-alanine carboxypeptidase
VDRKPVLIMRGYLGGASPRPHWQRLPSNWSVEVISVSTSGSTAVLLRCANCSNTVRAFRTTAVLLRITKLFGAVKSPGEIGQLLDRVAADRLDFDPGHGWRYSNVGYLFVRQLIEEAVGRNISDALRYLVFDGLGLESVSVATSAQDLADTAWGNRIGYDPGWVYHGLLIGTPGDAVRFLHSLMSGDVLPRKLLTEMTTRYPIGEQSLPDRPWETTGYGLGLMIGRMASAGTAIGHSGGGPGSVSAVYHFGDRPRPCTVAAFATGDQEGTTEYEVVRLAQLI